MATYVLLHGAYQGGWIWQRVTPHLRAAGHTGVRAYPGWLRRTATALRPGIDTESQAAEVSEDAVLRGSCTTSSWSAQAAAAWSQPGSRKPHETVSAASCLPMRSRCSTANDRGSCEAPDRGDHRSARGRRGRMPPTGCSSR